MDYSKPSNNNTQDLSHQQQLFIENQNNCVLCNSQLEIKATTYLENYNLREEAHCPKCNIVTRVKDHKMH